MKRLITLLFFAFLAITSQAQVQPNLPAGTVPFGTGLFRAPDGDIWGGSKFDGYTNLGNWERVADSLGAKINWSDTTLIATKEWVNGRINSIPTPDYPVESVTGTLVDNTDPKNPVINTPTAADVGALAPGDNVSELNNDAGYLTTETDPTVPAPVKAITQTDINNWNAKQDEITGAATTIVTDNLAVNRSVISNSSGKIAVSPVTSTELGYLAGVTGAIQAQIDAKVDDSEVGAANGVAPIGADGKVPSEYLPVSGSYKGTWDASTNTPTLADGVGTNGDRYRVSVGGTVNLGSGDITFVAGDDVIYNGTIWQRSPSGVTVTSVAGKTGDVVLVKGDVGLGNVDNTSDLDKPISTATQNALDGKEDAFSKGNLVAGSNVNLSGTLTGRLVGSGDITIDVPGADPQTLSLGASAGVVAISGGNSVQLTSLGRYNVPDFTTFLPPTGFYNTFNSGSTGYPSAAGMGIHAQRSGSDYTGSFAIWKNIINDGKLMFNVGTTGLNWKGWETVASEEHTEANYLKLGSSAATSATFNGDVSTLGTGLSYITKSVATNTPSWATNDGVVLTVKGASNRQLWLGRLGEVGIRGGTGAVPYTDDWIQLATTGSLNGYLPLSGGTLTGTLNSGSQIAIQGQSASIPNILLSAGTSDIAVPAGQTLQIGGWDSGTSSFQNIVNVIANSVGRVDLLGEQVNFPNIPVTGSVTEVLTWGEGGAIRHRPLNAVAFNGESDPVFAASPAGSITQTDIDNWNEAVVNATAETVIPTTVNFTINWQTDIAPGSSETYAELHGNHFVYSAFYDNGTGEVNYSPAISINRDTNGDIQTVEFGDIQSGAIIIK